MSQYNKVQIIAVKYKTGVRETNSATFIPNKWAPAPVLPNNNISETCQSLKDEVMYSLIDEVMYSFEDNYQKIMHEVKLSIDSISQKEDMISRLKYFAYVSSKIITNDCYIQDTGTLKCILWPEFYWCPENTGAYSMGLYRVLKNTLRQVLTNKLFNNTLVVNGTIVWEMGKDEERSAAWSGDKTNTTYFNCSLINYNGEEHMIHQVVNKDKNHAKIQDKSFIIQKAYMSGVDGAPGFGYNTEYVERIEGVKSANFDYTYYQSKEAEDKHVFTIGDLKIGLDICLEHSQEMLSKAIKNVFNEGDISEGTNILDIQLLTACGMKYIESSLFLTKYGTFGRVDGSDSSSNCIYQVQGSKNFPYFYDINVASIYESLDLPKK